MLGTTLSPKEQKAIKNFLKSKNLSLDRALTFDDVALPEKFSKIRSRSEINDFKSELIPDVLTLNIPFISSNMESVTGAGLAIAIEREGGLGILPQSLPLDERLKALEKIRRSSCALIEDPFTVSPNTTLKEAKEIMLKFGINSLIVINKKHEVVGILCNRDWFYEKNGNANVAGLMTKRVITAPAKITFTKAKQIIKNNKIEKLPLVHKNGKLAGLITAHGLFYEKHHPRALRDKQGQFIRIGSVGVGRKFTKKHMEEVRAQNKLGIKALLIDTARAFSENTREALEEIKKNFPRLPLIVGNVSTPEGAKFLFEAGANVVKVGQGPGQACTTRLVGIGIPQLTAVAQCSAIAKEHGKTIIADGGIKNPGDVAKALIAGADAIMIGKLFAGAEESASPAYTVRLKELDADIMAKDYAGSASFEAQRKRCLRNELNHIRRPEGIKKTVPVIGPLKSRVDDLVGGLRSAMSYLGVKNIGELKEKGEFIPQTSAGLFEGTNKYHS